MQTETWLQRTKDDAKRTLEQSLCSGHGILSVQLPYEFYPPDGEIKDGINQRTTPQCRCFPGFTGAACEIEMDSIIAVCHVHVGMLLGCYIRLCTCVATHASIPCMKGPAAGGK